jgi:hypothetical protein
VPHFVQDFLDEQPAWAKQVEAGERYARWPESGE